MRVRPLTAWPGSEIQPSFSPDATQVALAWSGPDDDNFDIYVKSIAGGQPVRLTTDPAPDQSPSWSPDGRWIAFARQEKAGVVVYVVSASGGAERQVRTLGRASAPLNLRCITWCADAECLLVSDHNAPDEPFSISRISIHSGAVSRVTSPPANSYGDSHPAVSPDGRTIAFQRYLAAPTSDIYVAPVNGGAPRRVTFDGQAVNASLGTRVGRT